MASRKYVSAKSAFLRPWRKSLCVFARFGFCCQPPTLVQMLIDMDRSSCCKMLSGNGRRDKETYRCIRHIHTHNAHNTYTRTRMRCKLEIRQRRREAAAVQVYKIHFIGFHRPARSLFWNSYLHSPVGFPRCFLPSASVTPRNSNFRLPSLATLQDPLRLKNLLRTPRARASHI